MSNTPTATAAPVTTSPNRTVAAWWQATPYTLVFVLFFLIPLALVLMVSFWDFNSCWEFGCNHRGDRLRGEARSRSAQHLSHSGAHR